MIAWLIVISVVTAVIFYFIKSAIDMQKMIAVLHIDLMDFPTDNKNDDTNLVRRHLEEQWYLIKHRVLNYCRINISSEVFETIKNLIDDEEIRFELEGKKRGHRLVAWKTKEITDHSLFYLLKSVELGIETPPTDLVKDIKDLLGADKIAHRFYLSLTPGH